jgi:hypothetical protein
MSFPRMKPCPRCGNEDVMLYGYGDRFPMTWHVECDECHYMGPGGNKLMAARLHNEHANQDPTS